MCYYGVLVSVYVVVEREIIFYFLIQFYLEVQLSKYWRLRYKWVAIFFRFIFSIVKICVLIYYNLYYLFFLFVYEFFQVYVSF